MARCKLKVYECLQCNTNCATRRIDYAFCPNCKAPNVFLKEK